MAGPWEKYAEPEGPWAKYAASRAEQEAQDREKYSPSAGNSFGQNAIEGIGRGMASIGRAVGLGGAMQWALPGLPASKEEAAQTDKPLLQTGGGKVGNVVGQAATVAPAMFIPGANTIVGGSLIGAGLGAATTEGDIKDRLEGAAYGAGGGALGVAGGKALGFAANKLKASQAYSAFASQTANAGRDAAAQTAMKAGYVLPPTEVAPTAVNSALEGLSGKIKTSQSASAKNQPITNDLAKKDLGLPQNQPITVNALESVRANAGKAYGDVAQTGTITPSAAYEAKLDALMASAKQAAVGFPNAKANPLIAELESLKSPQFDASSAVAKIKSLRDEADAAYASGNKELGKALKGGASALEDAIEDHLTKIGKPELLENFREARQTIAKTYTVQNALNATTGDVSAAKLAAQLAKGKPLSGDLKTIAETAQAFPKATQSLQQNYNALSPWDYAAGVGSALASGNPLLLAAPLARPAVRGTILSKAYQGGLSPSYGQSQMLNGLSALANSDPLRRLLPAAGALASVPSGK